MPAAADARFYADEVKPILAKRCFACHSGADATAGLDLSKREAILKGGASGPAVLLDKPDESLLVRAINFKGRQMPPGSKLPQKELETLTIWVRRGLPVSATAASGTGASGAAASPTPHIVPPPVNAVTKRFWSFQPVKPTAPPRVKTSPWVTNPIDAFVLKRLETAGLKPNPPAARAVLLRRASYDLVGLPPSPEAVRAFVADRSPNAWEKVVDGLLASPQYGEKWGRHWLDLVRYAETNSYERDSVKPNAWRYRDYVIDAFNSDKPFDRFITEQLAGDELVPRTPERLIATGYYRLGIWDDEPADPAQALYDDLDDVLSVTGQTFLGLTVNCARCHDHKIDPIPQRDYYRLLSFFSGVRRFAGQDDPPQVGRNMDPSLRSIAPKAVQEQHSAEVKAYKAKELAIQAGLVAIENKAKPDFSPVEKEEFPNEAARLAILKKRVPRILSQADIDRYVKGTVDRDDLRRHPPSAIAMALCVTELGPKPRDTFILKRGSPHVPGEKVEPGFPAVLSPPPPDLHPGPAGDTSGRRLALARWIASPANPLTARVMANRLWHSHFGRGIVRSTSNFGFQGDRPTHPELLDWLANALTTGGWCLKRLHRLIMGSSTYRMSSAGNPEGLKKDPENALLWRFDMRRLEAEEVRDSLLAVNGTLNPERGGPSIFPVIPDEVLAGQSRPGDGWQPSSPQQQRRRSVYIHQKRSLIMPIVASFDGPETDSTCPARFSTTQPTQALSMLNSRFIQEQAEAFADLLTQQAGPDPVAQVKAGLWRALQRPPTTAEISRGVRLMVSLQSTEKLSSHKALAAFCLVALNLNEFLYLD